MSINGMMRTSISGMEAQSSRLAGVSANIANASTVGYKTAETQFSSILIDTPNCSFNAGGVSTDTHYLISRQGVLSGTSSKFDLGISGGGFFVVQDPAGRVALTRAGAFVPDGDGHLVNAAGFKLMGQPTPGGAPAASLVANGTAGLVPVSISHTKLEAVASANAELMVNVPSDGAIVSAADLPSANAPSATSTARTSVVVYGNLGEEVTLDIHYASTASPGVWEVSVFDAATRNSAGGFPYSSGPIAQASLSFDVTGQLDGSSVTSLTVPVPGGASMTLDLNGTSQLSSDFSVRSVNADGNPPNDNSILEIGKGGVLSETYSNGMRRSTWLIPLATVVSPDRMVPRSGNVFDPSSESGDMRLGAPGVNGLGSINSRSLEASTVDLSSELTDMIEAQRNYTANSKVFQTGSELMEVLVNLKR
jgi:flagellar hook protein FlgE